MPSQPRLHSESTFSTVLRCSLIIVRAVADSCVVVYTFIGTC